MKSIREELSQLVAEVALIGTIVTLAPLPAAMAHGAGLGGAMTYGPLVQGEVTQKFARHGGREGDSDCLVLVDGAPYALSRDLYDEVEIGTVLRFDGVSWTIVETET